MPTHIAISCPTFIAAKPTVPDWNNIAAPAVLSFSSSEFGFASKDDGDDDSVPRMIDDSSCSESSSSECESDSEPSVGTTDPSKTASILKRKPRYSSSSRRTLTGTSLHFAFKPIENTVSSNNRRPSLKDSPAKKSGASPKQRARRRIQSRRVSFDEACQVSSTRCIPSKDCYTVDERRAMWTNPATLSANAKRNRAEYSFDGWDMNKATEEDGMYYHLPSGTYIHPVHVHNQRKRMAERRRKELLLDQQRQREMGYQYLSELQRSATTVGTN